VRLEPPLFVYDVPGLPDLGGCLRSKNLLPQEPTATGHWSKQHQRIHIFRLPCSICRERRSNAHTAQRNRSDPTVGAQPAHACEYAVDPGSEPMWFIVGTSRIFGAVIADAKHGESCPRQAVRQEYLRAIDIQAFVPKSAA